MTVLTDRLHATCVAVMSGDTSLGVLLLGPPRSGKSDVALRLIDDGWNLVSDDQVLIAQTHGHLVARSPVETFGLLEVRGVGLVRLDASPSARLILAVSLDPAGDISRLPEPSYREICGLNLPCLHLRAFEASTPAKIRLSVRLLPLPPGQGVTFPFETG